MRTHLKWFILYTTIASVLLLPLCAFFTGLYFIIYFKNYELLLYMIGLSIVIGVIMAIWESGKPKDR
jgi:hypothetical protein